MALINGKAPQEVSQEDLDWLVNAARLGADFIKNGAPQKGARVLTDIANHFAAEGTAPEQGDQEAATVPCSSCAALLPNWTLYLQCMQTCAE